MQTLTLSSKNQIALPTKLSQKIGLRKGQKILIEIRGSSIVLTPSDLVLERLAGRVKVKKKISNMDKIVREAKKIHFSRRNNG